MTLRKTIFVSALLLMLALRTDAQEASSTDASSSSEASSDQESASENWNLFFQATSIGDYHGTFRSPYEGPLSLQDYPERDVSLTSTLFFTRSPGTEHLSDFRSGDRGRKGFQRRERHRRSAEWRDPARRHRHSQAVYRAAIDPARFRIRLGKGTPGKRRKSAGRRSADDALFDLRRPLHASPIISTTTITRTIRAPNSWRGA